MTHGSLVSDGSSAFEKHIVVLMHVWNPVEQLIPHDGVGDPVHVGVPFVGVPHTVLQLPQ
jgi:hypothetical protein